MLPVSYSNGVVTIASPEPPQDLAADTARSLTGRAVKFVVAPADQVRDAIEQTSRDGRERSAPRPTRSPSPASPPAWAISSSPGG